MEGDSAGWARRLAAGSCRSSGASSRSDHRIDAGTGHRPRTLIGDDRLPLARIEGGERGLDRDLHLPAAAVAAPVAGSIGRWPTRNRVLPLWPAAPPSPQPSPPLPRALLRTSPPPSPEYESAGEQVPTCNASSDGGSDRFRRTHRRAA